MKKVLLSRILLVSSVFIIGATVTTLFAIFFTITHRNANIPFLMDLIYNNYMIVPLTIGYIGVLLHFTLSKFKKFLVDF